MKSLNFTWLACLLLCCSSNDKRYQSEVMNLSPPVVQFMGHQNATPFFREIKTNEIFTLKLTDTLEKYDGNRRDMVPSVVTDFGITFTDSSGNIVVQYVTSSRRIAVNHRIWNLCANRDLTLVIFEDDHAELWVLDVNTGSVSSLGLSGGNPQLCNNTLFFTRRSKLGEGYIDLYRAAIDDPETKAVVVEDIFEEGLYILPEHEFIVCQISIDGIANKVVYNLAENSFFVINDGEIQSGNYYAFYDYKKDAIAFYEPKGFDIKRVRLPKLFPFKR